ncbi:MAG: hypothetical protein Q9213_005875 [Squamulea squamosa]
MSPINSTLIVVNSPSINNVTVLSPPHPSDEWQDSPYLVWVIRAIILGGTLFIINLSLRRWGSLQSCTRQAIVEGAGDLNAAAGDLEFSNLLSTNTEMADLNTTYTVNEGQARRSDTCRTVTQHLRELGHADIQSVRLSTKDEEKEVSRIQSMKDEKRAQTF